MTERTKPPFRADHVGSLIRPDKLAKARGVARDKPVSAKLTPEAVVSNGNNLSALLRACRRERLRLEERVTDMSRIQQENDQLKKDLQMLKQLEIQMQRRPQPYR